MCLESMCNLYNCDAKASLKGAALSTVECSLASDCVEFSLVNSYLCVFRSLALHKTDF